MQISNKKSSLAVFLAFLKLGLTAFGGPVAHLAYFRAEFVGKRQWLDDARFSDLVSLCQFLPGPTSSQVGAGIGQMRAGWPGAVAAWLGFTLPSALLMTLLAMGLAHFSHPAVTGALHGLKLLALAVVAQACWSMAKTLCPDALRAGLAVLSTCLCLLWPFASTQPFAQLAALLACAALGLKFIPADPASPLQHQGGPTRRAALLALALFVVLALGLPALARIEASPAWQALGGMFRAGAMVFGGGHVVLPLLQTAVVPNGVVSANDFLAGYGLAQAMPGPLFSFAAYLGALLPGPWAGPVGALLSLLVIYAPGMLLLWAAWPFWEGLRCSRALRSALAGVNAAVVGILLAALYTPIWTTSVGNSRDFCLALGALALLSRTRTPPALVMLACVLAGMAWLG
ncbi:MAG: chromate efflux transporter [Paucibacter sp.]|nr:chromate efflux transporter [Roseateles sp.]